MAETGLLAGLELVVRLVLVLVHVLQEVRLQGRREWMRKIGVDHNIETSSLSPLLYHLQHYLGVLRVLAPCTFVLPQDILRMLCLKVLGP